ncbi:N-acetylmuramoyl-L-alanine amidase [Lampropedia cohaerens]|uniref:N-acetylmuramoyl-L-alanine amidase n=1 Tax=Lampropedia cohaerens TaxID=1610491 RepID=A0A0U1Q0C7_9BURK|nr:N-acetylmuramoyl-L-alanine amidase [Lampropedia cohaerens]
MLKAGMLLCAFGVHHLARAQIGEQHYPKTAGIGNRKGIVAIRIWPAPEYSRVTIESENELEATYEMLSDPPRLFVDINHLQLGPELRNLETHVQADDPNIAGIRIAQNQPTVVRMVLDLKQPVRPEVFTLKPIDPYQHRLVFDLYPLTPVDPMAQLIEERLRTIAQAPDTAATPLPAPAVPPAAPLPAPDASDPLGDWIRQNGDRPVPAPAAPAPVPAPPPVRPPSPPPPPVPSPPATRRQTDRIYIVALDPGHGGEDPGAIGPSRTFEKNVVLAIALQVRERLNRSRVNGVPVQAFMTRDRDFFVPLATRVERARRVQSDLFVSIHADAALNRSARGASVYALHPRGATSAAARLLAEQENRADQVGGLNIHSKDRHVQNTLAAMSLDAQIRDSLALGAIMRAALAKATTVRGSRVEQANFAVLRNPDTPSVLVETGFISNPQEEQLLRSARHQAKLADAIAAGVLGYLERFPPLPRVRSV